MYIPHHFNQSDTEVLQQLIAQHPFAALVTHGKNA
ncbi:FMN-binding negative transcriptional regulator [Caballeronia temeraria]|nr:FMN-binding negative transcriptional regulator [Caballeronia temeraria]